MKMCTKCKEIKSLSLFGLRKDRPIGYQSQCKVCCSRSVIENRNLTKWNLYQKEYYKKNTHIYINNVNNRAQRKKKATFKLDEFNSFLLTELYDLAKRKSSCLKVPYEVDHIIPLKGRNISGLNVPWNMQVISRATNRRKSNKELTEYTNK